MGVDWPGDSNQGFIGTPPYPDGIFSSQEPPDPDNNADANPGNDPSWIDGAVMEMSAQWGPIDVMVGGTQYFRERSPMLM